jgi:hypothetical protein
VGIPAIGPDPTAGLIAPSAARGSAILRRVSANPRQIALSEVLGGLSYALDLT